LRRPTDALRRFALSATALCWLDVSRAALARVPDAPVESDLAPLAIDNLTVRKGHNDYVPPG